jgi:cell division septum initiation protein DivIVA
MKDTELKYERERLVELSKVESELSVRLEGETEKSKSLEERITELKEQLGESTLKCAEIEKLKTEKCFETVQLQESLKNMKLHDEENEEKLRKAESCLSESMIKLANVESELEVERSQRLFLATEITK